jgi:hypothetical protein
VGSYSIRRAMASYRVVMLRQGRDCWSGRGSADGARNPVRRRICSSGGPGALSRGRLVLARLTSAPEEAANGTAGMGATYARAVRPGAARHLSKSAAPDRRLHNTYFLRQAVIRCDFVRVAALVRKLQRSGLGVPPETAAPRETRTPGGWLSSAQTNPL